MQLLLSNSLINPYNRAMSEQVLTEDKKPTALTSTNVLLALVNVLIIVVGYFCKNSYEDLKHNLMPRQEIELRLEEVKASTSRTETQLVSIRQDMEHKNNELSKELTKLQLDVVKLQHVGKQ